MLERDPVHDIQGERLITEKGRSYDQLRPLII